MMMRTWRARVPTALIVPMFAAVVLVIGLAFFLLSRLTAPAADAATGILRAVAARGAAAGWREASPEFKAEAMEPVWEAFARAHDLGGFRSASWRSRSIRDDQARLAGWVTSTKGTALATMFLEREGGTWRLRAIALDRDQLGSAPYWGRVR